MPNFPPLSASVCCCSCLGYTSIYVKPTHHPPPPPPPCNVHHHHPIPTNSSSRSKNVYFVLPRFLHPSRHATTTEERMNVLGVSSPAPLLGGVVAKLLLKLCFCCWCRVVGWSTNNNYQYLSRGKPVSEWVTELSCVAPIPEYPRLWLPERGTWWCGWYYGLWCLYMFGWFDVSSSSNSLRDFAILFVTIREDWLLLFLSGCSATKVAVIYSDAFEMHMIISRIHEMYGGGGGTGWVTIIIIIQRGCLFVQEVLYIRLDLNSYKLKW